MKLVKDTTLRAILKGIYIIVDFDSNGIIQSYSEIDTHYLHNIPLETIKSLVNGAVATTTGKYKAVLTIPRDNIYFVYRTLNNFQLDFKEAICKCLLSEDLKNNIRLVMYGNYDNDIDAYDELYECNLCKYFASFYRTPKLKLNIDIEIDDLKTIIAHWINNYYFDTILLNGKTEYSLYAIADEIKINPSTVIWIDDIPYYVINSFKKPLDLINLIATKNNQLSDTAIYTINNTYIGNSLYDKMLKKDVNK